MSTAGYLLWGQIDYEDVKEQRNVWCGQRYGLGGTTSESTYCYNICR